MLATTLCSHCGAVCPANARFCIECGRPIVAAATGATTRLSQLTCAACHTTCVPGERFCVRCGADLFAPRVPTQPLPGRAPHSHPRVSAPPPTLHAPAQPRASTSHTSIQPGSLIMLVGLLSLLMMHSMWPGILLVVGIGQFVNKNQAGHAREGLRQLLWLGGLSLLIATGMFWPGIIVLFVLSRLLD